MVVLIKAGESYKIWNINFKNQPSEFSNNLLWGMTAFLNHLFIYMYFTYFPSILLIYIIFDDTNVKQR